MHRSINKSLNIPKILFFYYYLAKQIPLLQQQKNTKIQQFLPQKHKFWHRFYPSNKYFTQTLVARVYLFATLTTHYTKRIPECFDQY